MTGLADTEMWFILAMTLLVGCAARIFAIQEMETDLKHQ